MDDTMDLRSQVMKGIVTAIDDTDHAQMATVQLDDMGSRATVEVMQRFGKTAAGERVVSDCNGQRLHFRNGGLAEIHVDTMLTITAPAVTSRGQAVPMPTLRSPAPWWSRRTSVTRTVCTGR